MGVVCFPLSFGRPRACSLQHTTSCTSRLSSTFDMDSFHIREGHVETFSGALQFTLQRFLMMLLSFGKLFYSRTHIGEEQVHLRDLNLRICTGLFESGVYDCQINKSLFVLCWLLYYFCVSDSNFLSCCSISFAASRGRSMQSAEALLWYLPKSPCCPPGHWSAASVPSAPTCVPLQRLVASISRGCPVLLVPRRARPHILVERH